jgi:hypothetical protein
MRIRAFAVALVGIGSLLVGQAVSPAGPVGGSPATAAAAGARWLAGRVGPDGSIPGPFGVDFDATVQGALALAATGTQPAALGRMLTFLTGRVDDYVRDDAGVDQPGRLARLIMLATATGQNPRSFGGTDLVARMTATRVATGPDTGRYGPPNPLASTFIQGLVLSALAAAGERDDAAVAWLVAQQCPDGSWPGYRADTTGPCPSAFPPDTNGTSMAIMGLAAQGATPRHDPRPYLRAAQSATGWPFDARAERADTNSTALVIQALIALGENPSSWTAGGVNALDALGGYQLGCDRPAGDRGAFWYDFGQPGDRERPDVLATVQAVPAVAGTPFPLRSPSLGEVPVDPCQGATTTTTAVATTTPTTTTTVGVTTTVAPPTAVPTTTSSAPGVTTTTVLTAELGSALVSAVTSVAELGNPREATGAGPEVLAVRATRGGSPGSGGLARTGGVAGVGLGLALVMIGLLLVAGTRRR